MDVLALLPVELQRRVRDYVALYRVVTPARSARAIHADARRGLQSQLWVSPDEEEEDDGSDDFLFFGPRIVFYSQRKSAMWALAHPDLAMVCYKRPSACWP